MPKVQDDDRSDEVMEFDVVVVGGGPAGAAAARYSAMEGANTLLIERREKAGVPVQCGEFLPSLDTCHMMMPEARELRELFEPGASSMSMETEEISIISPKGREYRLPFSGHSIDRDRFDAAQVDRARKVGSSVFLGTSVQDVGSSNGKEVLWAKTIHGKDKGKALKIKAKVVIGADGPHSRIRRSLGLRGPKRLSPCVQWTVKADLDPIVEMYFGNLAPSGYAWVIPKKGEVNIGLGITGKAPTSMGGLLKAFAQKKGIDTTKPPERKTGGYVPSTGPVPHTVLGRYLLVGDAAGHVMATNGGGVPTALVGGRLAGLTAARHVRTGMALKAYEKAWRLEMGGMLMNAARTRGLASMAFGSDWRLELAMRIMGLGGMKRAITCRRPFFLF